MKIMMGLKILLVWLFAYEGISSDTLATGNYLVPPGYADAFMPDNEPLIMPGLKLIVSLYERKNLELDSVTLRVFNEEHQLLGEYCSSDYRTVMGPEVAVLYDTAVINYYGTYYIEASKPGHKTREITYELTDDTTIKIPVIMLERKDGSGWMMAGAVVIIVAVGAWWFIRRRKRLTVKD